MSTPATDEARARRHTLIGVLACISVFAITFGLTYPLLTLVLEHRGVRTDLIGFNAAMTPLGILLAWPWLPGWARRLGSRRLALACMVATAAVLLALAAIDDLGAWFVLRLLLGVSLSGTIVVSEAWINELAEEHVRGRVVSLYTTVAAVGFGIGPLLIPITGVEGVAPFVLGAAIVSFAAVLLAVLGRTQPEHGPEAERFAALRVIAHAPVLFASVAAFGFFDAATLALLPIYALDLGFGSTGAALVVVALIAGSAACQPAIGKLADRLAVRTVLLGCAWATLVGSAALPAIGASPFVWPLLFALGGSSFGIYTASMIELGRRFRGTTLVAGSAAMAATYAIGSVTGPTLAGAGIEAAGAIGLPVVLIVPFALLLVLALVRTDRAGGRDAA